MSTIRHRTKTLAFLALLVALPALIAAPVTAQDDPPPPVEVFIFQNTMTNPDANNDGVPDIRWQVQVTVTPLGGCMPEQGDGHYVSYWLGTAFYPDTVTLSTEECIFQFEAVARDELRPGCTYRAQIAWSGDNGSPEGTYVDGAVNTGSRPGGETWLSVRRAPNAGCELPDQTHFMIDGSTIVEDIPAASADPVLLALARQAGEIGEYTVRVEPEASALRAGCDISTTFTVRGNGERSSQELGAVGPTCPSRASIIAAPAHVQVVEGRHVAFNPVYPNILVDLSSLVRLESARIAIIQDVRGSGNRGEVIYTITRSCGETALDSPPPQASSSTLFEGRFTVHSPGLPEFGPVATYPVAAAGPTSTSVVGCSVTVGVAGVPTGCQVAGGNTQTLTWTAADPIAHFDFEFDFYCGGATPPTTTAPPAGDSAEASPDDAIGAVDSATADLRIVARLRQNGKIEFGLQQRQHDGSWGDRVLPRARLFPPTAGENMWLNSSAITLGVAESADSFGEEVVVRITARKRADGRVEFGLQQSDDGGASWSDRELPARRFFPTGARVDRWLGSSVISLDG